MQPTNEIIVAICMAGCMILGYIFAEILHRSDIRKMKASQRRNALVAEYMDRNLWQFISLDEWLRGNSDATN